MSYSTPDVYYQPEAFGLTIVDEIDDPDACYSFDIFAVWKHEDGRVFYGQDARCLCPSPFEGFTSLTHLSPLTDETWPEFVMELSTWCAYDYLSDALKAEAAMLRAELTRRAAEALAAS